MTDRKLKRREFLRLSSIVTVGAVAAACAPAPTAAPVEEAKPPATEAPQQAVPTATTAKVEEPVVETVEAPATSREPPLLASRVQSGQLPPLDERLPEQPLVVNVEKIGTYGGEIRMIHFDTTWFVSNYGMNAERMLHYSAEDTSTIVPNIFESWEVSPDGKTFTIKLRKGMKWSDGELLTTEDVRFWWEDWVNNDEISWGTEWQWTFGGEQAKLAFIDDLTFSITFAKPFGNFPAHLTRWHQTDIIVCSHYLKKFHKKYVDQAELDKMVSEMGLESWANLFWAKNEWGAGIWVGPENILEYPTISPWIIVDVPKEGLYVWERNPYYWKVDPEGNQLPYVDNMRYDYIQNTENAKLKLIQGEIDYLGPHDVTGAQYAFYKENEKTGNYITADYISCMTDRYALNPQFVLPEDPVLEKIVNDGRFVKALNVAIDREEINEALFFGMAKMGQLAPMPTSKYYKEKYGTAWAQYDPDLARQLLDEMGLKPGPDGIRLRPDGERLTYMIEHAGIRVGVEVHRFTEMVTSYWREVGIDAYTKEINENLWYERMELGQVHCGVWHQDRCTDMLLPIDMTFWIPVGELKGGPSSFWVNWYTSDTKEGDNLREPPDFIKQLFEYHEVVQSTLDENERVASAQKIFDYLAENPMAVGFILECPAPLLFNKNLRNLPPAKSVVGWDTYGISTYHPEGFYYEGGVRA